MSIPFIFSAVYYLLDVTIPPRLQCIYMSSLSELNIQGGRVVYTSRHGAAPRRGRSARHHIYL